ncbi:MAG: hypothetical protein AAF539_03550 [Planctomycetota bacterium]
MSSSLDTTGSKQANQDHPTPQESNWRALAVFGGCLTTLGSALISCVLLVINGALVLATITASTAAGAVWLEQINVAQFLLFTLPVALLVIEWMMIDYVRQFWR